MIKKSSERVLDLFFVKNKKPQISSVAFKFIWNSPKTYESKWS